MPRIFESIDKDSPRDDDDVLPSMDDEKIVADADKAMVLVDTDVVWSTTRLAKDRGKTA